MLALKTNTPILPITIDTNYKIGKPLRIVFHEPIEVETYTEEKTDSALYEELSNKMMRRIYEVMKYRLK